MKTPKKHWTFKTINILDRHVPGTHLVPCTHLSFQEFNKCTVYIAGHRGNFTLSATCSWMTATRSLEQTRVMVMSCETLNVMIFITSHRAIIYNHSHCKDILLGYWLLNGTHAKFIQF